MTAQRSGPVLRLAASARAKRVLPPAKLSVYERQGRKGPLMETMWKNPGNLRALDVPAVRRVYEAIFRRAGRTLPSWPA